MKKILITLSVVTNAMFPNSKINVYNDSDFEKINIGFAYEESIKEIKENIYFVVDTTTKKVNETTVEEVDVIYDSSVKTYMDKNKITDTNSTQYEIIRSMECDSRGHYYEVYKGKKYYCVALGSYFGDIGERYKFMLDSGNEINVIKCDEKSDRHTYDGYIHRYDKSVIEFIINEEKAKGYYPCDNGYVNDGNFNNYDEFNGNIHKIYKID